MDACYMLSRYNDSLEAYEKGIIVLDEKLDCKQKSIQSVYIEGRHKDLKC